MVIIRPGASPPSPHWNPTKAEVQQQISVRIDRDILAKLREAGPGWQSRINTLLRTALDREALHAVGQKNTMSKAEMAAASIEESQVT